MFEVYKQLITSQYQAALCTLNVCVDRCPEELWNANVGNHTFCSVVFHTLFFSDYHLGENEAALFEQPFHREHADVFEGYEQLEFRKPVERYERSFIKKYMEHTRKKAGEVLNAETIETLKGPSGFERRTFTRAELHVYNMRHIQHHSAQLSLRLRLDAGEDIPWIGTGWCMV